MIAKRQSDPNAREKHNRQCCKSRARVKARKELAKLAEEAARTRHGESTHIRERRVDEGYTTDQHKTATPIIREIERRVRVKIKCCTCCIPYGHIVVIVVTKLRIL
jgi:hypothetical protein